MSLPEPLDWVSQSASYTPHAIAIKDLASQSSFTYAHLNNQANELAHRLCGKGGLKPGDRIAILAPNHPIFVVLFALAQKTGVILVPLNWRLSPPEIQYLLEDAQPSVVIVADQFSSRIPVTYKAPAWLSMEKLVASLDDLPADIPPFPQTDIAPDHPLFLLYTSGTTGFPKAAIYSYQMLFWNSINTGLRLDLKSSDRTLNVMPLFHTGGWNVLLTPFLHRGAMTLFLDQFQADEVLRLLSTHHISIFMGVPTMLAMMAESPLFEEVDLSALRYMIVGGEAMPVPLIKRWQEKGIPIRQGYGMTEAGPNLTSLHHDDALRKIGSIGTPNYYVQTCILDESGQKVAVGQPGELCIKGPIVTPGYWNNAEATAKAIVNGWLHTGDMVQADEEGFLYVVDRIKNMYISGGENVYPAEVERILTNHPAIISAAVIAIPHPRWGEAGHAYVVWDGDAPNAEAALNWCRERLAKFKVPQAISFCEELPKNATGKIDRKELKDRYQATSGH